MEIGHGTELSWFYLGTAAERLGYRDAAAVYYRRSIAAASDGTPCQFDTCEGFDLPKASSDRLLALATATPARLDDISQLAAHWFCDLRCRVGRSGPPEGRPLV